MLATTDSQIQQTQQEEKNYTQKSRTFVLETQTVPCPELTLARGQVENMKSCLKLQLLNISLT